MATQEGRFFRGYYKGYCYLPLYVFCGRGLLLAKPRPANIDAFGWRQGGGRLYRRALKAGPAGKKQSQRMSFCSLTVLTCLATR